MILLRQNTATTVHIGPLLDNSTGQSLQNSVTIGAGVLELYQAGATSIIDLQTRTWSLVANGVYQLGLTVGDLSVVGPLQIHVHPTAPSAVRPFLVYGNVLVQAAYDALMGGGTLPANVTQIAASSAAANNLGQAALGIQQVVIGNASSTTIINTTLTQAVSAFYVGRTIVFITGVLAGQAATITGYNGATKAITVAGLTVAPSSGDTAVIV